MNGQLLSEHYETPKSNEQMPKYLEIIHDENDMQPAISTYETPVSTPWYAAQINTPSWHPHSTNVQNHTENSPSLGRSSTDCTNTTMSNASTTDDNRSIAHMADYNETILTVTLPANEQDCTANERLLLPPQSSIQANDITDKHLLHKSYVNSNIENAIRNCDGITSM